MSRRTRKNVGVIGLGIIGSRVANNLRRHGFHVFVWNRTPRPVPNFVGSVKEIAELCDFIQIFVSDDEALLAMVQRMTSNLTPHHIVMAHSTVSPETMRTAAEIVQRRGAQFLDAPFTGSKAAAESGQLIYYIGGDEAVLGQARPVLEASSKEILEMGAIGQATTIKVATNMVTAATVQVAAEALALVHSSGLAPEKFTAAMRNNGSNSATLDMKLPQMLSGNFETNFSVKHMLKDVAIASRLGRAFGLELGATDAARHSLLEEVAHGRENVDYASLVRRYFPDGVPQKKDEAALLEVQPTLDLISENPPQIHQNGNGEILPIEKEREILPESGEPEVQAKSEHVEENVVVRSGVPISVRREREEPAVAEPASAGKSEREEDLADSRRGMLSRFWRRGVDD